MSSSAYRANRQVCDVLIYGVNPIKNPEVPPILKLDTANTTGLNVEGDSVFAMAKGSKRIPFAEPIDGTVTVEAQVYPYRALALYSDGKIITDGVYADTQTVECTTAGTLSITVPDTGTINTSSIVVYPVGFVGDENYAITGTYASGTFTATTASDIAVNSYYDVTYIITKSSGIKKIRINNKKMSAPLYMTMKTVVKDEDGTLTPYLITIYRGQIKKSFELSFSSEGDPMSISFEFDLLEDIDGNVIDLIELTDEADGGDDDEGFTIKEYTSAEADA